MLGKIGLEEHFATTETVDDSFFFTYEPEKKKILGGKLLDFLDLRIKEMDQHGMEMMILSLNAPAIQARWDKKTATGMAQRANDTVAEAIAKRPDRYRSFAALAMQDPDEATRELERCVKDLGFVGALVNGFSQIDREDNIVYLDDPRYRPFWAKVQELGVPFYLHPRSAIKAHQHMYTGHPWLTGAAWGFAVETGTHCLRLMCSGLFDELPKLQIIIGHLGECLPAHIWRTEHRLQNEAPGFAKGAPLPWKGSLVDYFNNNFYVTTSGNFRTQVLLGAMMEIGSDRVLFSTDYPFEKVSEACEWFDRCDISENDRRKIGRQNIIRLLNLKLK